MRNLSSFQNSFMLGLHPGNAEFPASNTCTVDVQNSQLVLAFDNSGGQTANWRLLPYRDYQNTGLTINLLCAMATATSGNVILQAQTMRLTSGTAVIGTDSFSTSVQSVATPVPATAGVEFQVQINLTSAQVSSGIATDFWRIKIGRAASTATGNLWLLDGEVRI